MLLVGTQLEFGTEFKINRIPLLSPRSSIIQFVVGILICGYVTIICSFFFPILNGEVTGFYLYFHFSTDENC